MTETAVTFWQRYLGYHSDRWIPTQRVPPSLLARADHVNE